MKVKEIVDEIMVDIAKEQADIAKAIIKKKVLEVQNLEIALGKAKSQLEVLLEKDVTTLISDDCYDGHSIRSNNARLRFGC